MSAACAGCSSASARTSPTCALEERAAIQGDVHRLAALKYVFVTAIEGCADVAQHVCASEGWGPPRNNADAMRVLARHCVLTPELAAALASAVGFRNVLVHAYADVDDERVVSMLARLDELAGFVSAVAGLLGPE